MFCPNCGTKNDDALEKCTQCGFDLQAKKAPAKFKGTMMMQGGANPLAAAGITGAPSTGPAAKPSASALKGTMVGVAPPSIAELRDQMARGQQLERTGQPENAAGTPGPGAPAPGAPGPGGAPRPSAAMKGTMVGVAPPGVEELRRQASLAAPEPSAPAASKSAMKGTMIGLAPPNIAELRKQLDAAAQAPSVPSTSGPSASGPSASGPSASGPAPVGQAPVSPGPTAPSVPNVPPAATSATPSRLKGTMIGVAPPDVSSLLEKAKASEAAGPAVGEAAPAEGPGGGARSDDQPSDVNAFGGTMVGTSPFAPGGQFAAAASFAAPESADPNGHTVPSPPPEDEPSPTRPSERPESFAATSVSATAPSYDDRTPAAEPPGAPEAPSAFSGPPPRPKKNSNGAVIVLSLSIVLVLGLILLLVSR